MSFTTTHSKDLPDGGYLKIVTTNRLTDREASKKEYFNREGKHHRLDGPAVIYSHITNVGELVLTEHWFKNGIIHRADGPAIIHHSPYYSELYFINGIKYTEEEFQKYIQDIDHKDLGLLGDLGQTF